MGATQTKHRKHHEHLRESEATARSSEATAKAGKAVEEWMHDVLVDGGGFEAGDEEDTTVAGCDKTPLKGED